jgi:hypothetical protein
MSEKRSKQNESAAYHEAGHIVAAVLQAMPLREGGVHVDLYGHGCADYFQKVPEDIDATDLDHRERKLTMISIFAAHMAQLKFYPECGTNGWVNDLAKIKAFAGQIYRNDPLARSAVQQEMRERASKLVDKHWSMIEKVAKTLLAKPYTPMSQEDMKWGMGEYKQNMRGEEIADFFAGLGIIAKIIGDDVRNYDSAQDTPYYDSLA